MKKINRLQKIRIYLTENCNANCEHCFNAQIRETKHMDENKLYKLYEYLNKNEVKCLKMMGGEPTIHPEFTKIYKASQQYFESVALFTNGLNNNILKITPREKDSIVYNFLFINDKFNFNKLVPKIKSFSRLFEIVIDSKTNLDQLFENILLTYEAAEKFDIVNNISFQLTPNCIENVFQYRKELNEKFLYAIKFIIKYFPERLSFDHDFPYCWWYQESIEELEKLNLNFHRSTCSATDAGLIDSKFDLLHCNQYPLKICSIFNKKNELINFNYLVNSLIKANFKKRNINFDKGCSHCEHFNYICTGGCLMHKKFMEPNLKENSKSN